MPAIGSADIRAQLHKFASQHPELGPGKPVPQALVQEATAFVNQKLGGNLSSDAIRLHLDAVITQQAVRGETGLSALGGASNGTVGAGLSTANNGGVAKNKTGLPNHPGMFNGNSASVAANGIAAAQKLKDPSVTQIFTEPSSRTSTTVKFTVDAAQGKELKPGERWLFQIPPDMRGAAIRTVILVHRKDEKYASSVDASGRDQQGAYDLVTARKTGTNEWVKWSDHFGDAKFAEPRSAYDAENENLHDWLESVGKVPVDIVAVTGMGKGELAIANVHSIEIEFFPPGKIAATQEEIFTPGTVFPDADKGIMSTRYGGGQGSQLSSQDLKTKGLYPNAVQLGGYGTGGVNKTSENTYVDQSGNLHIKLPAGKKLGSLEVAVGDTQFDKNRPAEEQRNKDGHYGSLGWAKLSARVENKQSGTSSQIFSNANVPPSGVLSGGPTDLNYITKPGDEIVIANSGSTAHVMGYRLQFMEQGGN